MNSEMLRVEKEDERGVMYDCGSGWSLIIRKKGTVSADHEHEESEIIIFLDGEVELTVGKETRLIKELCEVHIPANIYHKLVAHTDIKLLHYRV